MSVAILDRDGVINLDSDDYIKSPSEWVPIESSIQAIKLLKDNDFKVYIATNQSGVGRGLYTKEILDSIHKKFFMILDEYSTCIDGLVYCPHTPLDDCLCRKPKPGLFYQIRDNYNVNLGAAFSVGDSLRDLEAAKTSGIDKLYLVRTGKGIKEIFKHQDKIDNLKIEVFDDLLEVVNQKIINVT